MSTTNITILAFGSMGDLVPYVALGSGLQAAGYRVRFVSHERFEATVRSNNLDFCGIDDDPAITLAGEGGHRWVASGTNLLKSVGHLVKTIEARLPLYAECALQQSQDADAIIASSLASLVAVHAAEKLKIPYLPAFVQPLTPTAEIANAFVPTLFHTAPENWLSHRIYYRAASIAFRRLMDDVRRTFGLDPGNSCEPFTGVYREDLPVLYGFSPSVLPRPRAWKKCTHVTGYWFLPYASDWQPPPALADFLGAGPPPVSIGFGSMVDRDPEGTTDIVLESLRRVGCRGLLLTGWGGMKPSSLPDNVFAVEGVPHEWLFPRVAAVVHHAGAGTTAATLRAGVPSVCVPFLGDQFFWARQLNHLGVAPRPVPRLKLSVDALEKAIAAAIDGHSLKQRAVYLASRIASEDGVNSAVAVLHRYLN
jgi:sterol 3beta-glucosyltransferase